MKLGCSGCLAVPEPSATGWKGVLLDERTRLPRLQVNPFSLLILSSKGRCGGLIGDVVVGLVEGVVKGLVVDVEGLVRGLIEGVVVGLIKDLMIGLVKSTRCV